MHLLSHPAHQSVLLLRPVGKRIDFPLPQLPHLWNGSLQGILWSPDAYFPGLKQCLRIIWLLLLGTLSHCPHLPTKRASLEGLALPSQADYLIFLLTSLLPGLWEYSTLKSVIELLFIWSQGYFILFQLVQTWAWLPSTARPRNDNAGNI